MSNATYPVEKGMGVAAVVNQKGKSGLGSTFPVSSAMALSAMQEHQGIRPAVGLHPFAK